MQVSMMLVVVCMTFCSVYGFKQYHVHMGKMPRRIRHNQSGINTAVALSTQDVIALIHAAGPLLVTGSTAALSVYLGQQWSNEIIQSTERARQNNLQLIAQQSENTEKLIAQQSEIITKHSENTEKLIAQHSANTEKLIVAWKEANDQRVTSCESRVNEANQRSK